MWRKEEPSYNLNFNPLEVDGNSILRGFYNCFCDLLRFAIYCDKVLDNNAIYMYYCIN